MSQDKQELEPLSAEDEKIARNVMMIGTHHLNIAQMVRQREELDDKIRKEVQASKKLEADTLRFARKAK